MSRQSSEAARRQPGWIGRDARNSVLIGGIARRDDGTELEVFVHDLSRDGCRIECNQGSLDIGEWVEVEAVSLAPQRGQVRWALLGSAGVRFASESVPYPEQDLS